MKANFKIVKSNDSFEVINQHGFRFRFSQDVGVAVAVGALVQKTILLNYLDVECYDYEYEFTMTKKK